MSVGSDTFGDFVNINNLRSDHFKLASGTPAQRQLLLGWWLGNLQLRLILLRLRCGSDSDSSIHSSLVDLLSLDDFGARLVYMHKRCIQKITERWSCPQGIFFGTRCGATTLAAARAAPPLPSHSDHV